ncbi:MAG: hypothetical protein HS111_07405 [Kofleriaceae bacterium]|nr:hypothetical protein [Kofleriaceae bacterium]
MANPAGAPELVAVAHRLAPRRRQPSPVKQPAMGTHQLVGPSSDERAAPRRANQTVPLAGTST